eukprot:2852035-Pyramimonas_sp.AAC.2
MLAGGGHCAVGTPQICGAATPGPKNLASYLGFCAYLGLLGKRDVEKAPFRLFGVDSGGGLVISTYDLGYRFWLAAASRSDSVAVLTSPPTDRDLYDLRQLADSGTSN